MTGGSLKNRGALEVILFDEARFRGSMMFTSAEVTVGSAPGVMIRLDDPTISPCHAVLRFDGETCAIENFDPIQGTLINGDPVERQEVAATDEIRVGRFRLRVNVHRADATPAPVSVRSAVRSAATASTSATSPQGKVLPLPVPPAPTARPAPKPSPVPPARPIAAPVPPPAAAGPPRPPTPSPPTTSAPRPPTPPPPTAAGTSRPPTPPPPTVRTASSPLPGLPQPAASAKGPATFAPTPNSPASSSAGARPSAPAVGRTRTSPAAAAGAAGPVRGPSSAGPAPAIAPTLLAVPAAAEPTPKREPIPLPEPAPPAAQPRPTLSSVPAQSTASSSPRAGRTSTQPITSHYADARVDRARPSESPDRRAQTSAASQVLSAPGFVTDDDDDDAFFEPGFSLFEKLRESGAVPHKASAVEVVRFRQGCILKLHHLRRGEPLRLHGLRKPLGRCSSSGGFVFSRDALPDSIAVTRSGEPVDDVSWREAADEKGRIALEPATQVLFPLPSGEGVLVHLVSAAAPLPRSTWQPRSGKRLLKLGAVSLAVHLFVFMIIGLTSLVRRDYIADSKEGRFARIALKEIELEPPAPPPKPEKEKEKKKAKPEPSQVATAEPTHRTYHLPRTRTVATPQAAQSAATTQKLLSALGGISSGPKPMSATAMSNLAAVGPVHGGGFKVSGAIGRLPGDSLRLAAAGSGMGHLETKSAGDVAKNLGRVLGRGPSGQVRAQVTAKPNTMKVEGHLDRGEIQKVINSHIHELQGCYERQLVMNPNLAGKVTFEWVIGTNGGVTTVKIKASTLSSNEATSCMQAAIRRWQFPAPSGGQVTVIYPIALASSGT